MVVLSATGLAFKNGLYIFMLRQFFRGVPDSLEESAYIDGSGVFRTFIQIILPMSVPMMITVFIFAFSWQWTDDFYTNLFFPSQKMVLMPDIIDIVPPSVEAVGAVAGDMQKAIRNTWGLLIIFPLVIMYLFCQNFIVQGIERSGITGE
jgi:multiple sugar transport system permease protein